MKTKLIILFGMILLLGSFVLAIDGDESETSNCIIGIDLSALNDNYDSTKIDMERQGYSLPSTYNRTINYTDGKGERDIQDSCIFNMTGTTNVTTSGAGRKIFVYDSGKIYFSDTSGFNK